MRKNIFRSTHLHCTCTWLLILSLGDEFWLKILKKTESYCAYANQSYSQQLFLGENKKKTVKNQQPRNLNW